MPKASAAKAPWVVVWESPQTTVMPGRVAPSSGPITCTMPCNGSSMPYWRMPSSRQLASSVSTCSREIGSSMPDARAAVVGTL